MECIPKYKPIKRIRKNLFEPPPYCKTFDRKMALKHSACIPVKLEVSDPSKILQLVETMNDANSKGLEKKINRYLQRETESQLVFLIGIMLNEATIQVVGPEKIDRRKCKLSEDVVENLCSESLDYYTMENLNQVFQTMILGITGTDDFKSVIVPICGKTQSGPAVVLACIINPKKETEFCVKLVNETFKFCLTVLLNTTASEEESRARQACQTLLDVAKKLFQHLDDFDDLLREIMVEARNLVNAERCSLFLIDSSGENLVAKVFDGSSEGVDVKISKNMGIAGHVYKTGKLMNITDVYHNPFFYKKLDEMTDFRTKNILCFPIRDEKGIIGVAQLCNKKDGTFTVDDEDVAKSFSAYCGLAIMHMIAYKRMQEAQIKTQLSNELMMYHMKIDDDMFKKYLKCKIKTTKFPTFDEFNFLPRQIDYNDSPCYTIEMFKDLNLVEKFGIKMDLLTRFILYVMKGYRDTPYHNWRHAFSVTHFAYTLIKKCKLIEKNFLTHLEALALLTSCLGHDVDHRGTTNAFQLKIGSPLANLYSSEGSVMERHHLSQTICILNTQKCNFLECLDNQSYELCIDYIKDNILATDLANHFKIYPELEQFIDDRFIKEQMDHRRLLFSLIMTCSDLSDQTKGFKTSKEVAQLVYEEFFNQGDLEKKMGNKPLDMMDREKASIPDLQIQFLEDVCLPAYNVLAHLFPKTLCFLDILQETITYWEASKTVFEMHALRGQRSFDILMCPTLEDEIEEILHPPEEIEEEICHDDVPYSFDQDPSTA
ncbi:cGMP-dependent 3',5'-cyclic phosphodiesterase-like [Onthophagus taurus]|uniref:cGMP-dependent 3',5'-cyclic phosphodiesterase-like n=1 Tax=Onthophagus taurus TaxID=166361 RepID=UPI000C206816|nr:cGMP-dependent 3',5'-cyclic phosphodiesterase-like [Onthophagus taurus]